MEPTLVEKKNIADKAYQDMLDQTIDNEDRMQDSMIMSNPDEEMDNETANHLKNLNSATQINRSTPNFIQTPIIPFSEENTEMNELIESIDLMKEDDQSEQMVPYVQSNTVSKATEAKEVFYGN